MGIRNAYAKWEMRMSTPHQIACQAQNIHFPNIERTRWWFNAQMLVLSLLCVTRAMRRKKGEREKWKFLQISSYNLGSDFMLMVFRRPIHMLWALCVRKRHDGNWDKSVTQWKEIKNCEAMVLVMVMMMLLHQSIISISMLTKPIWFRVCVSALWYRLHGNNAISMSCDGAFNGWVWCND